jgi:hypothetical protein
MPDNSPPQVPNYVPGVGALVTYRLQFEEHINGTNFRQNADTVNVIPNLVVGETTCVNVLEALEALAAAAEPPVIALATQTTPGIIQLTRDLGGTNGLSPIVIGLQGRSVSAQQPTTGQVLTWNSSAWAPANVATFNPGGDLGGSSPSSSNTLQYVSSLTGSTSNVTVYANTLTWQFSTAPTISQGLIGGGTGEAFNIHAQNVSGSGTGGTLVLSGGTVGSGVAGSTLININGFGAFQVGQVLTGNNVVAFLPPGSSTLTSTEMPVGTGNGVIYIGNAATAPAGGSSPSNVPVGGAILYGQSGQLWIKQADATTFQIGSIPDPSTWTSVSPSSLPTSPTIPTNGTLTYNVVQTSGTSFPVTCFTFAMPASTSCRFDTVYVAKEVGTGNTAQYNYSIGFIRNGSGAPTAVGSVTSSDPRSIGASWIAPTTTATSYVSGNNIVIPTGSSSATSAIWTVITQVVVTTA